MTHFVLHTLLLLFIAFFVGLLLGFWLKSIFTPKTTKTIDVSLLAAKKAEKIKNETVVEDTVVDVMPEVPEVQEVQEVQEVTAPTIVKDEKPKKVVIKAKPTKITAAEPTSSEGIKPQGIKTARGGNADNLKRISGIGPANEKKLNGLGIYHFDQIAAWTKTETDWVNEFLAFPGRVERENWIQQADILAKGVETNVAKKVD